MAPLQKSNIRKLLVFYFFLIFLSSSFVSAYNEHRKLFPYKDDHTPILKKNKSQFKKLNPTNSAPKITSLFTHESPDPIKTVERITNKETKARSEKKIKNVPDKKKRSWSDQDEDDDDLVEGIRDLHTKFQETIVPDLQKISKTSKVYLNKYNKAFTKGFKPFVGNKYAPTIASAVSLCFIFILLILVSLIFNRIKVHFSLQKLLILIQIYLSIYFSILCLTSFVTGVEPLRVFYSTSYFTFVCVQVLQTLGYALYLVLLLLSLILVLSAETGLIVKLLGLTRTFLGFGVGLHYYMTVFHRAVLYQPPKTSWKAHALYATCFLVICLFGGADGRKKIYLEEGGEEGKRS